MQENRVVVTGLGVIAPNGLGVNAFTQSLQKGQSGIRFIEELAEKKFACQIGGIPLLDETYQDLYLTTFQKNLLVSSSVLYGVLASMEAWKDAGLEVIEKENTDPDWETGCIFGTGLVDGEIIKRTMTMVDNLQVRRLGSTSVTQGMTSAVSAFLGGILGLGNQVTTNASACSTGNEAIMMAYYHIKNGLASRMIAGSSESPGPYIWGGFDSMRLLNRSSNDQPETGSAPMSAHAKGFVPGSGAGALVLESLESAQARGAKIYTEILGGFINSGGQRGGGSMTAPNLEGIRRCIQSAIKISNISPGDIDLINGHLTSTMADPFEIKSWSEALGRKNDNFPYIQATKSLIGHCLSAAGSIESVATVLQLHHGFIHPSLNLDEIHPDILSVVSPERIPQQKIDPASISIAAKSSFGFGDVNCCTIFRRWEP